jgi:hypothetical protein
MYESEENMLIDNFDEINFLLCCMELAELYSKLKKKYRNEFLVYIKGEFSSTSIEDDYSDLINKIIHFLGICKTGKELEKYLTSLTDKHSPEKVSNIINSMLDYLYETVEYIEYNF